MTMENLVSGAELAQNISAVVLIKPLTTERHDSNIESIIFEMISMVDIWAFVVKLTYIRWIWLDLADDKSTLVEVMAWFRQAANH